MPMLACDVGSFQVLCSVSVLPLSSCTIVCTDSKRRGPTLSTELVREGDFPLCVPPGPLALLQENSAVFHGRLRPCSKRMKEFGRPRKAWITAGGQRVLWTYHAEPFSVDVNESSMCVCLHTHKDKQSEHIFFCGIGYICKIRVERHCLLFLEEMQQYLCTWAFKFIVQ